MVHTTNSMDALYYANDQWELEDKLGMATAGDTVALMALQVEAPFTIGVNGKWGSGKTSVLRRAFATLGGQPLKQAIPLRSLQDAKPEVPQEKWDTLHHKKRKKMLDWEDEFHSRCEQSFCVWYSPWQHQNEENPLIPLLLEVQEQFSLTLKLAQSLKDWGRSGGLAALTLLERVVDAATSLTIGKTVRVASGTSAEVHKAWKSAGSSLTEISDGQRFHLLFEDAVEQVLAGLEKMRRKSGEVSTKARLIIFIDDLDRCEESTVVALLEAIKLYLGTKRCVFVLGIDDSAVLGALQRHWATRGHDENREYLEKLFQAMVAVPLPQQGKLNELARLQLSAHGVSHIDTCCEHICRLLEPNPRKVKNFVNSLCTAWNLFKSKVPEEDANKEAWMERLLMFHYLRLYHRPVWRILERQPWTLQVMQRVLNQDSSDEINKPPELTHITDNDRRMLREFFSRQFSHVLQDTAPTSEGEEPGKHRGEGLDSAVENFLGRLDRKRSDDYLVSWFRKNIDPAEILSPEFLFLE